MSLKEDIAKNIKARRVYLKLTQQQLADRCKKTVRYINYLENSAGNVTIDTLEKVAMSLEISVRDLLQSEDSRKVWHDVKNKKDHAAFEAAYAQKKHSSTLEAIDLVIGLLKDLKTEHKT